MRHGIWTIVLVALMAVAFKGAAGEEWKEVFADDFNRPDIFGPDWTLRGGWWDVRGNLKAKGPGAVMMCARQFQTPFRIEYTCFSDNPGDLSIEFDKKAEGEMVCFAGFGSEGNTLNKIIAPSIEGNVAVSRDNLIEAGRKHKVTVEVNEDGLVRQTVDGRETVKATVKMLPKSMYFGLYVWNHGVFNSVKVYSPNSGVAAAPRKTAAKVPAVREFQSFDACQLGKLADAHIRIDAAEKCSVNIVDDPTWLYCFRKPSGSSKMYIENEDPAKPEPARETVTNKGARLVPDPCVELLDGNGEKDKVASAVFPVPEMKRGLIEFDLMADRCEGDGLRIMLDDKVGLWINKDGDYYWVSGTKKARLSEQVKLWAATRGVARLYFQPGRWFTLRLDFDLETSLASVSLVDLFTGAGKQFIVGEDLPLPLDSIKELKFETCGKGRFLLDNMFMISRTDDLAPDDKWKAPARELMKAYYPLRKDPLQLKSWSMRNIRYNGDGGNLSGDELQDLIKYPERYAVILACAEKYNRAMVQQAFLNEGMKGLTRAWIYAAKTVPEYQNKVDDARQAAAKTESLLGELYRFYADCYLDRLNQDKLKEGFDPRLAALDGALEAAKTAIRGTLERMRGEVIAKTRCKFTPYPVEAADTGRVEIRRRRVSPSGRQARLSVCQRLLHVALHGENPDVVTDGLHFNTVSLDSWSEGAGILPVLGQHLFLRIAQNASR